jgi:hypothetical protein
MSGSAGSSGGASGGAGGASGSSGAAGSASGSGVYSGSAGGGVPDIPTGTGTGAGDLDEVFGKSLGDYDGDIAGERDVIASSGGGSAKGAGQREEGDSNAVSNGTGNMGQGSMPDLPGETGGDGQQGSVAGSGSEGGQGGQGTIGGEGQREGNQDESGGEQTVVKLPDDIPVDGSADDVVGRQIREAAIAMQDDNPKAAEALWDEYRKHTGIK